MANIKFPYLTIRDVDVQNKRILMRADYNVPLDDAGAISDDFRITSSVPTIEYLTSRGAKVVLVSHLGRPKGQINEKYTLRPVAVRLSELLGKEVKFVSDCIGEQVTEAVEAM